MPEIAENRQKIAKNGLKAVSFPDNLIIKPVVKYKRKRPRVLPEPYKHKIFI